MSKYGTFDVENKETAEAVSDSSVAVMPGTSEIVNASEVDELIESNIITLKNPYTFEGKEYTEIDLTGMEDMTAGDMIRVEKLYSRANSGLNVMPEVSEEYALFFAASVTKLPIEFFYGLPAKTMMRIKNRVMGFLFGED